MQALSRKMKKFPTADKADRTANQEYEVQEFADESDGSTTQRFTRLARDISFFRNSGRKLTLESKVVLPDNQIYQWWIKLVLVWAVYSSFFTPLEFGFFQGLPRHLWLLDLLAQLVFLADIIVTFFVAYKDESTYKMVVDHRSIASRYAKTDLFLDLLGCMPWDMVYKASGKIEGLRFLVWVRLYRVRKVDDFFRKLEKDIRISYFGARIAKLLTVELYCTHTAACIFYYLATTEPVALESDTWIGSITLGGTSFHNFRDIPLATRYITALYWAILTMSTVGYGDIHAVNPKEMVFVMIYVSFDMILGAYLIGNMTALIVKGSNTENFRDKMAMLIKYMNRHSLGKRLRQQMKNHTRLRYESKFMEESIIEDLPVSIRAKVSQALYRSEVEHVPLFKNCSNEFISQLVNRMHEEYFLPGEVIMEQGNAADQIYIVSHGLLEEVLIADDGSEEIISQLEPQSIFGEVAVLSSIPQPYTVRVCELCKLLRLDKQSLDNIMQIYFKDGRQIVTNLLEEQEGDCRMVQFTSDISFVVAKQEIELALRVNAAVFRGDLQQVKSLIKAGAHPTRTDYDGRTPLHLAASRGYEDMVLCLIQEGANVNSIDNFGNTPLMEAVKCGYDNIISLLVERGGLLLLKDPGICLCNAVINGDVGFLKRLLQLEVDPNATDYDHRTPLHIAAAEGFILVVKLLLNAGANILAKDRWGRTPLHEGHRSRNKVLISLLEKAKEKTATLLVDPKAVLDDCQINHFCPDVLVSTRTCTELPASEAMVALEEHRLRQTENASKATSIRQQGQQRVLKPENVFEKQSVSEKVQEDENSINSASSLSQSQSLAPYEGKGMKPSRKTITESQLSSPRSSLQGIDDFKSTSSCHENIFVSNAPEYLPLLKRCTIFPHHPSEISGPKLGRVVWVPESIDKLLQLGSRYFGGRRTHVLNADAGAICNTRLILDGEKLFVVDMTAMLQAP